VELFPEFRLYKMLNECIGINKILSRLTQQRLADDLVNNPSTF